MQNTKTQMSSLYHVSGSHTHNNNTGSLFQVSKQQVLKIPFSLQVVTELIISRALCYVAGCI